jgi:hypothetical protein
MVEVRRGAVGAPGPSARTTMAVAGTLAVAGLAALVTLVALPAGPDTNVVRARLLAGLTGPTSQTATGPPLVAPPARATDAGTVGPVALTGCPPPPRKPGPPAPPPWHPAALVPESALPKPPAPTPRLASSAAAVLAGKGLWIWQPRRTEAGNVDAIVHRAVAAGLTALWVRVADSQDGFYGASFLTSLVPAAHRQGLAVIGWGFPHLYDPVADARWTAAALAWRAPGGDRLDGWSADIETASEGTALSARRATAYLGLVRPRAEGRPLVATVFPPTDYWWSVYPFRAMAPYIDAFAPMLYWGCREPGDMAAAAIRRLSPLAPVHVIGQAYDMAPVGGRVGSPSGAEISRFLDVARRDGATGASFWDWQAMSGDEWTALSAYPWLGPVSGRAEAGPG